MIIVIFTDNKIWCNCEKGILHFVWQMWQIIPTCDREPWIELLRSLNEKDAYIQQGESDTNLDLLNSEPCVDCQKITPSMKREDKNNTFLPCTTFLFLLDWFQLQGLGVLLKRLSEATLSKDSCLFFPWQCQVLFFAQLHFGLFPSIHSEKNIGHPSSRN